ncbi:MAG: glucose-6-phosphate isomerase [Candidatus Latescibacterota bacterium]
MSTDSPVDSGRMKEMRLRLDFNHAMAQSVGQHGITADALSELSDRCVQIDSGLRVRRASGALPFYELPYQDVGEIRDFAAGHQDRIDTFVGVGIGGSALGSIALHTALRHPYHNQLTNRRRQGAPKMYFPDNVDPDRLKGLFEILNPARTLFNVVTKSGSTAETMSTFLLVREWLMDHLGDKWREHVVVTTDRKQGDLRTIADLEGLPSFEVPDGVGGRFTALTAVSLLPAAFSGIDIQDLLDGAAAMDHRMQACDPMENPAFINASLHYLFDTTQGKHLSVMMPYAHALADVADWYRQLWAESLGKKTALDGTTVHVGPTPIKALGATDQHSQVQLYVEGPFDKVITFLAVDRYRNELTFPSAYENLGSLGYLAGHSMSELIQAERMATEYALTQAGRPNVTITLPEVCPHTVGQLLYMLEVQTVFSGGLYAINPLDQPGVEEGKKATYALMGRGGYEAKRAEIEAFDGRREARYMV